MTLQNKNSNLIKDTDKILKDFTFNGFYRQNGTVGVRNHLIVLPASVCADPLAEKIAAKYNGTIIPLHNQHGCCQIGDDFTRLKRVLIGLGSHPNVGACLLIALGCEGAPYQKIHDAIAAKGTPVELLHIQESGGSNKALDIGLKLAEKLKKQMDASVRIQPASIKNLCLGLECGGSDTTSGIAANPVLGWVTDRIVAAGGTVILSETTEIIGAEHILARRAADEHTSQEILRMVKSVEERAMRAGVDIRGTQPTPGNIAGGLTTIEEKSLGCIYKAGTAVINEAIEYGNSPTEHGLVFMDTPGQDVESMTGMAAGGSQLMLFSTGRGSPVGFPIAPVLKVTGNPATYKNMEDDIDINAGTIVEGVESVADVGVKTIQAIISCCNGNLAKAEKSQYYTIGIFKDQITL